MDFFRLSTSELVEQVEASRRALLKYFNSQTMTHGGYLIALIIGCITLISRWDNVVDLTSLNVFYVILFFIFPMSFTFNIGKIKYYGNLTDSILRVQLDENVINQLKAEPDRLGEWEGTIIYQLFKSGYELAKKRSWITRRFYTFYKAFSFSILIGLIIFVSFLVILTHIKLIVFPLIDILF